MTQKAILNFVIAFLIHLLFIMPNSDERITTAFLLSVVAAIVPIISEIITMVSQSRI